MPHNLQVAISHLNHRKSKVKNNIPKKKKESKGKYLPLKGSKVRITANFLSDTMRKKKKKHSKIF
jgi:ribosomal protein L24